MKACPHCQFLVPEGSENCSVCKQPVTIPSQPMGPWGADPGPGFSGSPPLPGSQGGPSAGSTIGVGAAPRTTSGGAGKVLAIVAVCVVGAVVFGVAGLAFLGTTSTPDHIDAASVKWQTFRDPAGAYSVELPGPPLDAAELLSGEGVAMGDVTVSGALTNTNPFTSGLVVYTLPAGVVPDLEGGVDSFASGSFTEHTVTERTPVETPFGPGIDAEVVGTLTDSDVPGIAFIRTVLVAGKPYLFLTLAPSSSSPEAAEIQQRMVSSFAMPAAA